MSSSCACARFWPPESSKANNRPLGLRYQMISMGKKDPRPFFGRWRFKGKPYPAPYPKGKLFFGGLLPQKTGKRKQPTGQLRGASMDAQRCPIDLCRIHRPKTVAGHSCQLTFNADPSEIKRGVSLSLAGNQGTSPY